MAFTHTHTHTHTHTNTNTNTHYLASTDDRPASSRETPKAKSLSALPSSGWVDHAQLKAHPLPAMDESHSRTHSRQWMNVSYVHASYVHGKVKHNTEWLKSAQVWISKRLLVWLLSMLSLSFMLNSDWWRRSVGRAFGPFSPTLRKRGYSWSMRKDWDSTCLCYKAT